MAAALIFVPGAMPSFDRNGDTCVAELYFYTNDGTYTPKAVYTASDLMTPHPFPVVSDASGVFPQIWADQAQVFTVSWKTREADPQTGTWRDVAPLSSVLGAAASLGANTFTAKQILAASTVSAASETIPHGVAPTSPVNGDVWTTTSGMFVRINGITIGPLVSGDWDFIAQDEKANGVGAGNSAAATRQDRNISVVKRNTRGLAVTNTSVTLTAGTWLIKGMAPCSGVGARLYICDAAGNNDVGFGENALAAANSIGLSHAEGIVTLASDTPMFLQQYTTAAVTNGLGLPITTTGFEIYSKIYAKKIG